MIAIKLCLQLVVKKNGWYLIIPVIVTAIINLPIVTMVTIAPWVNE